MTVGDPGLPMHFLKPGEMLVCREPTVVTTLLGSCVAVTMFCPRLGLGAICHALLPACRGDLPCDPSSAEAGRYVECAIRLMLSELTARGGRKDEIQAKLFGGGDMFETAKGSGQTVGRQNLEMALAMLEGEGVRLVAHDLGGRRGRKIVFHTHTGEVFLKRMRTTES